MPCTYIGPSPKPDLVEVIIALVEEAAGDDFEFLVRGECKPWFYSAVVQAFVWMPDIVLQLSKQSLPQLWFHEDVIWLAYAQFNPQQEILYVNAKPVQLSDSTVEERITEWARQRGHLRFKE